ncbi:MAG: hypothetical protein JW871_08235 [Endomicrobiales bacterium]|nr:hypothetical protein [Endomicrobiales bacterium]
MSLLKLEEVKCPCSNVFEARLWTSIDVRKDPELKEALVAGEINVVSCPVCHQIFYAERFILYHDPDNEILAFVYPKSYSSETDYWNNKMHDDFKLAMENIPEKERLEYEPMLLFSLDSLVDIVQKNDEDNDEIRILEFIAKDLGLSLIELKPALARLKSLPRLLPKLNKQGCDLRDEIMNGFRKLLDYNANLEMYKKVYNFLEENKDWKLDNKLIRKEKAGGK